MTLNSNFKFLNVQKINRKKKEGETIEPSAFFKINLLDDENNPCAFYSFDDSLNGYIETAITQNKIKGLQDCKVTFEIYYSNDNWRVRLVNIEF